MIPIKLDYGQPTLLPIGTAALLARVHKDARRAQIEDLSRRLPAKQYAMLRTAVASFMLDRHPALAGQRHRLARHRWSSRIPRAKLAPGYPAT